MKINLTSVMVDDQSKALKFYTEVLGFAKRTEIPMGEFKWLTVVSPFEFPHWDVLLFNKAQNLRVKLQGLVLVIHHYTG